MNEKTAAAGPNRQRNAAVALAAVLLILSGVLGYRHLAGANGSQVSGELIAGLRDQKCNVQCSLCGVAYTMVEREYVDRLASGGGKEAVACDTCGGKGVWRARPPIEYSDGQWRAGQVGRDVLVSELKAYHEAHPEGGPNAANPEDEDR